jgi:hypothetical protein
VLRVSRRVLLTVVAVLSLAFVLAIGPVASARPLPECNGAPLPCAPVGLHTFFTYPRPLGIFPGGMIPCP